MNFTHFADNVFVYKIVFKIYFNRLFIYLSNIGSSQEGKVSKMCRSFYIFK